MIGAGMVKGAVKTSELLFTGADYAKTYIKPENPRPVDPRVVKGLEVARMVSSGACKVSGWMVSKVGSATLALGRMAAPHLERGASKAITHFSGQSSAESNHQLKIVGEVASGSLAAVSTLYIALENSSKILAKNMANNTVMIVSHKYGTDAAAVADAAFATAGNSYLTFYNTAALGPKSIAKRAAKDAGKAVVGFDAVATRERAERAPDLKIGAEDVLQTFQTDIPADKPYIPDKPADKQEKPPQ
ncbi:protein spartin [Eurytemora carolleeae]|uniref:protein spartin n=1 Tax=Eurytemora carolleeae TaxID=1294199 RepID=UPI000C756C0C|nr:protein spartin [Eurytemora carolleeae]|eukprot:XP_023341840.1 protein spartin-like [Eurytemora affinis]